MDRVGILNNSQRVGNEDLLKIVDALNGILPLFLKDWQIGACRVELTTNPHNPKFQIVLNDSPDVNSALGYHFETSENVTYSKVFANPILNNGGVVMWKDETTPTIGSVIAHELFEMLANPNCNIWWMRADGVLFAGEVCDPVQGNIIPVRTGETTVGLCDWITPHWYDPNEKKGPFNHLNTLTKCFEIGHRGYAILCKGTQQQNVFGSSIPSWQKQYQNERVSEQSVKSRYHSLVIK